MSTLSDHLFGLSHFADRFDLFVIDQWGVLHNGRHPYPGAREALEALKNAGKTVIILSNSSRPASDNIKGMNAKGFKKGTHFDDIVTSGEAFAHSVRIGKTILPGNHVFLFTPPGDDAHLHDLGLIRVATPEMADFLLIGGSLHPTEWKDILHLLNVAKNRNLPAICANPDIHGMDGDRLVLVGGAVAKHYEEMGGTVTWFGKPYPDIYETVFDLASRPAPGRGLAIGDSLLHDIKGGCNAGLVTCLIACGIHGQAFGDAKTEKALHTALVPLSHEYGVTPDLILPRFVW
ncbi:MAG: TIGR01459 family HAD-type hydrolase [Pseudomonadota bacterium]|nr:TIGR01459 family HAD-type hydrolase [Pseudomonadota bacterium]